MKFSCFKHLRTFVSHFEKQFILTVFSNLTYREAPLALFSEITRIPLFWSNMFFVSIFVEKNLVKKFYSNTVSIFVMKIFWKKFNQIQYLFLWWKINGKTAKSCKNFRGGVRPPHTLHILLPEDFQKSENPTHKHL